MTTNTRELKTLGQRDHDTKMIIDMNISVPPLAWFTDECWLYYSDCICLSRSQRRNQSCHCQAAKALKFSHVKWVAWLFHCCTDSWTFRFIPQEVVWLHCSQSANLCKLGPVWKRIPSLADGYVIVWKNILTSTCQVFAIWTATTSTRLANGCFIAFTLKGPSLRSRTKASPLSRRRFRPLGDLHVLWCCRWDGGTTIPRATAPKPCCAEISDTCQQVSW